MTTPAPARKPDQPKPGAGLRFLARQPIFTREEQIFGYELLFRDGPDNYFSSLDPEAASRDTLDSSTLMGLDVLCGNRRAFVNCTREVLLKDYLTLLPSNQAVAEILESVPPDDLVEMADIIKVDMRSTSAEERSALVRRYGSWRCRMLAEKVETREEFFAARQSGFLYFQGYFFRQPEIVSTREVPANRVHYVKMLQAVAKDELDHQEIEDLIKSEASLCYRLLRYMNSASFGFANEIHSVKHALSLLGEREVRRWVRLVATLAAGSGKTSELVLAALARGRFCELLSQKIQHQGSDLFLLGLFSLMDTILETPMADLLGSVPVDQDTRIVLLTGTGRLSPLYKLMVARESGEWESIREIAQEMQVTESGVAEVYWQAMEWARAVNAT